MLGARWRPLHKVTLRTLVTAEALPSVVKSGKGPVTKKRSSSKRPTVATTIYNQFQTSKAFVDHYDRLNSKLFRNHSAFPVGIYCLKEDAADTVFSVIKDHLSPETPIIELYPGLGLLTRRLLTLGPKKVIVYESDPYFRSVMETIASEHDVLTIVKHNFLQIWKEDYKDKLDGGKRVEHFLPGLERKPWNSEPLAQMIGAVVNPQFFRYLINSVAFQNSIMSIGRPEMYLIVPPDIFWHIKCRDFSIPPRWSKYILFNLFFDSVLLSEVEASSYLPRFRRGSRTTGFLKNHNVNPNNFYLMKVVPKRHLLDVVHPNLLRPLWFFVYQGTVSTKNKVIPYLEKWIPGCGPIFISKGLSVFTEFRDLTYDQLLDVFLTFTSLPEFDRCTFHAALDTYLFKSDDEALDDAIDISLDTADQEATEESHKDV